MNYLQIAMSGNSSEHIPWLSQRSSNLSRAFHIAIWISIITVFVLSFLDLAGWVFKITLFKSISPNWETMKIITSICLIFVAAALVIIQLNLPGILWKILTGVLATFICLVALITIFVYLYFIKTGHELSLTGISYLTFFIAPVSRMAFLTACNFLLIGFILFLLPADKKKTSSIAHVIIIPVISVSYFVIVSYMLGVYSATELDKLSVALNTGIAFCGICVAVLLIRPNTWFLTVFTSSDTGGIIARRLIPGLMILPVVIGWLRINGERADLFKSEEGVVLVAITYTLCFLVLVWFTARSVNIIDLKRRNSEESLRESEQRLKYHFENSPLAVLEWNADFVVTQWSVEAEHIFGWNKAEVIGKRIDALNMIYEEDIPKVERIMNRLSGGKELNVVSSNRNYTKKREVIECTWYNTVLQDSNGQMSSVMSLVEDITTLRKTEKELIESKESYKELVTNARSILIKQDTKGIITFINEFGQFFFGYKKEELIGKSATETIVPHTESTGRNLVEMVENIYEDPDKYSININENIKKDGERVWIEWYNKALFDKNGKNTGHMAIGIDITERILAEQKVKERTKDLESVNARLNQELTDHILADEALKKSESKLRELNATKDKFFNIVAHDLKNPFTSLLGSSELLFQNIKQMDQEKIITLATILNDSAKSGYAILQNLLDWSRSQTGLLKFNPEIINLRNLIDENILNLELFSANKGIEMHSEVKEDMFIFADKNMINTVLRNLLNNAVKFTSRCGKVTVSSAIIASDEVIISVKDSGTGISEENIEKLFRIDTKYSMPGTNNEQGTGLGLKLCKEFVEKQGGKIWVESIENKGSEFKFSIPVKEKITEM